MTVLLAIDTSIGTSVALLNGDDIIECGSDDARGHTEAVGGLIAEVFAQSGATAAQIEGVVVGIGPGPFTGLRVGIAAATAFALGRSVPLLPLSGHEAVALESRPDSAAAAPVRVLQDAKRRELFVTEYAGLDADGVPRRVGDPLLLSRADVQEEERDVWPERIPAAGLLRLAQLRLRAGRDFEAPQALYLRTPDVYQNSAPKRVTP